jgi:hypothetical protein
MAAANEYRSALDYIQLDAGISLIKFRKVNEILVSLVGQSYEIAFSSTNLYIRINELFKAQLIHKTLSDQLHEVRELGNQGAHPSEALLEGNIEQQKARLIEIVAEEAMRLQEAAEKARILTVENMKDLFFIILNKELGGNVEIIPLQDKSWEAILINALSSQDYHVLLKAGKVYDLLANNLRKSDPFNESLEFDTQYQHLKNQAATCFESALKLSVSLTFDQLFDLTHKQRKSLPEICYKNADIECLFLYWSLNHESLSLSNAPKEDYRWALEASAKRGYAPAMANLGGLLINESDSQYKEGLRMLLSAADEGDDLAFYYLFLECSRKESQEYNIAKALDYLNKGAELGGAHCTAHLGVLHHQGELVSQSNEKAEEYLLKAMQIGCIAAESYYFKEYLKKRSLYEKSIEKDILDVLQGLGIGPNKKLVRDTPPKKIRRNDPCSCGSGKKYKKCCISS